MGASLLYTLFQNSPIEALLVKSPMSGDVENENYPMDGPIHWIVLMDSTKFVSHAKSARRMQANPLHSLASSAIPIDSQPFLDLFWISVFPCDLVRK